MKIWYKIKSYIVEAYLLNHYPSLLSFLLTKKQILVYYGFLGDKNFGDELVYESAKILFCDFMLIPYKKK
ncbi:MAG: hypothetical protein ACK41O_14765, partial [Runella zeae]